MKHADRSKNAHPSPIRPEVQPAKLNAVNDKNVESQLLAPFFEMLLPAFENRADEIRIESAGSELKVINNGDTSSAPLPTSPRGYAATAFSRILILAGMSIALEGAEQAGGFRVRYGQQFIPIQILSKRDDSGWYLIFRPAWEEAQIIHEEGHAVSA